MLTTVFYLFDLITPVSTNNIYMYWNSLLGIYYDMYKSIYYLKKIEKNICTIIYVIYKIKVIIYR